MEYPELRVPLPVGPRYEINNSRGTPRIYYRISSERVDKKLKHHRKLLGRIVEENEERLLIPNENYFEHMKMAQPSGELMKGRGRVVKSQPIQRYSETPEHGALGFGYGIACYRLSRDIGLWEDLESVFGSSMARDILAVAAYMGKGSTIGMSGLDYFIDRQMLFTDSKLTSQRLSEFYRKITRTLRTEFFTRWLKRHASNRSVCYDVTSISNYSKNISLVSYGYNRDHEKLAQINLGLFCSIKDKMPLCYSEYNGNINDFTNFPYVISEVENYGILDNFLLVMDGGFAVSSTIDFTAFHGHDFLMGAPIGYCSNIKNLLLEWRESNIAEDNVIEYNNEQIRVFEKEMIIGSTEVRVLMYKSPMRSAEEECTLTTIKNTMIEQLDSLKDKMTPEKSKKYNKLFEIEIYDNGKFKHNLNNVAFREARELCGCFALITNRKDLSILEALELYRDKDNVEKLFGMMKNDILQERLHVAILESLQGKIFLAFIALILRRIFMNKLNSWIKKKRTNLNLALEMLCDIECRKSESSWWLSKSLTAQQKDMVKILDLPIGSFIVK